GYHTCRHWRSTAQQVKDYILCSKGFCDVFGPRNTREPRISDSDGKLVWRSDVPRNDMYQTEHDELFASIRAGRPINNGEYAAYSTLLAIMARMAAYTGQVITWDMALQSKEDLSPPQYAWGDVPRHPVPRPGVTR